MLLGGEMKMAGSSDLPRPSYIVRKPTAEAAEA